MKAKDYARLFNESPVPETVSRIGIQFDKETSELVKSRKVKTDQAFLAILKEMDLKWQAFARLTDGAIKPDGYRIIMKALHPTTAAFAWPAVDKAAGLA